MLEIVPTTVKLTIQDKDDILELLNSIRVRFVDLVTKSDEDNEFGYWTNQLNSVCFELRRPTTNDMARLTCMLVKAKPEIVDFQFSNSESTIVFWAKWTTEKENI